MYEYIFQQTFEIDKCYLITVFVEISHKILLTLREQGYNALKSVSECDSPSPTFRPAKIQGSIGDYLMDMQLLGILTENQHFIEIDDVLETPEDELLGVIFVG